MVAMTPAPKRDEMWTQKDGSKIAVGEMTETHAKNALRMILRNERRRTLRLLAKLDEARLGGFEDEAGDVLIDPWGNS